MLRGGKRIEKKEEIKGKRNKISPDVFDNNLANAIGASTTT